VSALPLFQRYAVRAERLAEDLSTLAARQDEGGSAAPGELLLVAEQDGAAGLSGSLLGFARVLRSSERTGGQFGRGGYLRLIALHPGHSGRGVGARLLSAVEDAVRTCHPDLFLLTSDFNHGAQRFYERAGYLRVGALPDFVHAGITELIYWKRLTASGSSPAAPARAHES
jgi:GNAT superfamily N-acetyltransferase